MKSVTLIGHISDDLLPSSHLGGSVTYAGIVFQKFGFDTTIITKAPPNHPYLQKLSKLNIKVINLERDKNSEITSFNNSFNDQGLRTQMVDKIAKSIKLSDLKQYKKLIISRPVVLAPILNEIDVNIISHFYNQCDLYLIAQGLFRKTIDQNLVTFTDMNDRSIFSKVKVTILSYEDLMIKAKVQEKELNSLIRDTKLLIITNADKKTDTYTNGKYFGGVDTYDIGNKLSDPIGAGDVFAAAFIIRFLLRR